MNKRANGVSQNYSEPTRDMEYMYMYIHVTVISAFHTGNYELGWHIIVMIVCIHVQCICVMCLLPDTILHVVLIARLT